MFRKHSKMWSGRLARIVPTEHRINLQLGALPSHTIPYGQGPVMRKETLKNVRGGVIGLVSSDWVSPAVLAPKKDGKLRFSIEYHGRNVEMFAYTYLLPRRDD